MNVPRTVTRSAATILIVGSLAAGCATAPTGPSILVLPGAGKSIEQFRADDTTCRLSAVQQAGSRVPSQREYDIAYIQCMYAKGHQIPSLGGSPTRYTSSPGTGPSRVPPPPPGPPPPPPPGSTR